MDNKQIAKVLSEIALLLELKDENSFKVRAFQNAARTLLSLKLSSEEFVKELKGSGVKGFGPQLSENILTYVDTGSFPVHEELRAEFPDSLLELLQISGLGAKKIKALYQELEVDSISSLKEVCLSGKVSKLRGFGSKTVQNLLLSIEEYQSYSSKLRFDEAEQVSKDLQDYLMDTDLIQRIDAVGELRRRCEIVEKLEFIATSKTPDQLLEALNSYSKFSSVEQEDGKFICRTSSGFSLEINLVDEANYIEAMILFTGSEKHIDKLRKIAKKNELDFEQVFSGNGEDLASESSFYNSLSLSFIEPELREGHAEVDRSAEIHASKREATKLIESADLKGIIHAHTTYSDGTATVRELALYVKEQGYQYLGVSDHSKSAAYAGGLSEDEIKRQHEEIDLLNEELAPFKIFKGIESDILKDGSLDYSDKVLESFDFVIASLHSQLKMEREEITNRVVKALSNPYTTILGHPTTRKLLKRKASEIDMARVMEAASVNNVAIEINANPKRLDIDWRLHQRAKELGINMPICPDAHSLAGVEHVCYGVNIARKGGLSVEDVFTAWDLDRVSGFFKSKK